VTEPRATDDTIADAERPTARISGDEKPLDRGATVGRYVVLSKLGAGGMGIVYAAYDPELDRKVALKLLRAEGTGTRASEGRTRILREAQALAKLSHPHVVAIHDVGTHGEQVFLAMEFVEGKTLGEWAKEAGRSWREKLRAIVDAGRGVAAAHAAGLLHRDLKPENVMVGNDGRVRVMDLGLARAVVGPEVPAKEASAVKPTEDALAASLTRAGAVMGTPAYMAPEQHLGLETDARADQFSLCVTAWEVFYGERPFGGDTLAALAFQVTQGRIRPPPRDAKVPSWIERVLRRGFAAQPDSRWPTVDALLVALGRGQARRRARLATAALGVLVAVIAAGDAARRRDLALREQQCDAVAEAIDEVWGEDARRHMHDGLAATGVATAELTAEKVAFWLDRYADRWRSQRRSTCMHETVDEDLVPELADKAQWCLEDRRLALAALVDTLTRADAQLVHEAVPLAAGLASPDACADTVWLAGQPVPPDAAARQRAASVRAELARAEALGAAGSLGEASMIAETAVAAAAGGWPPLASAALRVKGELDALQGSYADAEASLTDAYMIAARAGAWETAAEAAIALVDVVGVARARHSTGREWSEHAAVALAHAGDVLALRRADRATTLAVLEQEEGHFARARELHDEALEIRGAALGRAHPAYAESLANLASATLALGDLPRAKNLHAHSLEIREATLGAEHPDVAESLNKLAMVHGELGEYAAAEALLQRGIAIQEKVVGPDHPTVAITLNNLAMVREAHGEHAGAMQAHERALAIKERVFGERHPRVANTLNNLALLQQELGEHARARELHERALSIWETAYGPDHPDVAMSLTNLGHIDLASGDLVRAEARYARALDIRERTLGEAHLLLGSPLSGLAEIRLAQGRPGDALQLAERALQVRERGAPPVDLAETRFVVAQALWESGEDRPRALVLARQAEAAYREQHIDADALRIGAWIGERGGGAP
jgi:tetratricopeptide (TPR) repeat protein/predicted Ser/Thr protein kinase